MADDQILGQVPIVPEPRPANPAEGDIALSAETAFVEIQHKQIDLTSKTQDIDERKRYAFRLFILTSAWLFLVLAVVCASGIKIRCPSWWPECFAMTTEFQVSDSVLLALIGSTTANVLGLFVIVARYLFPDGKK